MAIVVRNGLNVRSSADLLKAAREKPGAISFGTWGVGSTAHLAFAMLEQQANIDLNHIAFQGAAPVYMALLTGNVDMSLLTVTLARDNAKDGKVEVLGVTATKRSPLAPNIPTMAEAGFSGYAAEQWVALFSPKNTPLAIRDRINREVNGWLTTPEAQKQMHDLGFEVAGGTPSQLAEVQKNDISVWSNVIKAKNIRLD